jgi:hypothetical protein
MERMHAKQKADEPQMDADGDRHVERCLPLVLRSFSENGCEAAGVATSGSLSVVRAPIRRFRFHSVH